MCVLEVPCRLVECPLLHPVWQKLNLDVPEVELHLEHVALRRRFPLRGCASPSSPSSTASPITSAPSVCRMTVTRSVSSLHDLSTHLPDLPPDLFEKRIVIHEGHIPVLVHRHVCSLVADSRAALPKRLVVCGT